ncbi:MAG: hypothetical protein K2X86_19015 [Cytophagaceae bacterium]|nr:hypothetical protein [Cytophagaceae bacterium]
MKEFFSKRLTRYFFIALLIIFNLFIGFIRSSFVFNFEDNNLPWLIKRSVLKNNTGSISENISDIKWISLSVYSTIFIISTALIVYLLFLNRRYVLVTFKVYGLLIGTTLVFYLLAYCGDFNFATTIANKFKNLIQEPLVAFLIIAYCFYEVKTGNNKPN